MYPTGKQKEPEERTLSKITPTKTTSVESDQQMFEKLQQEILENIDRTRDISDEQVLEMIDQLLLSKSKEQYLSLSLRCQLRKDLFNSLRRLGILQELIDDEQVTEIMINGTQGIFVERQGALTKWDRNFSSKAKLEDVIQQMVSKANRRVNEASPIVDTRLENGSRVNVVMAPVAINGPAVTIRRFPSNPISMNDLIGLGSITKECATFLQQLVIAGYNIFISGGTGSGKTTFLNVLSDFIPKDERVITIEDSAELQLQNLPDLVRLEARMADTEGKHEITIRQLIKASLRMRPNRIVVGEVRGREAIDMLQAFNTGHDGSLSTGHANSPKDMLSRLEMMVLMGMEIPLAAVRRQLASGIDIIVHLGRVRDKSRKVLEIDEVLGVEDGEIKLGVLYAFDDLGTDATGKVQGSLKKRNSLTHKEKLAAAGISYKEEAGEANTIQNV